MPEIAEIALTSEILSKYLKNQTMLSFNFISGRYSKKEPLGFSDFVDNLPMKVTKIDSVGKFMWFELKRKGDVSNWYIWNTFGLTGMWSLVEPKHCRAIIKFKTRNKSDVSTIYFADMRNFGTFKFSTDINALEKKISSLRPDFLKDDKFNLHKIQQYKIPIVKILMDQKKVGSGLGNYLVAEILYRARISPHKLGNKMTDNDIKRLTYWIKYVVKLSYMDNETEYMVNLAEEANKIKRQNYHPKIKLKEETFRFNIYRKKKDPYGNKVKAEKIVGGPHKGRTTYWVPAIQK